ncbi:hypothetical protein [Idiomarina xiamenensis]|uniref:Membrane protein n=1 Tax=Idiomarina xiamenensis 10-D-4 TaxID=740709 RepID=K2KBV4_9GAMM|nr:hypothetical protein [Idiomarina xiamenensis]EKE85308.1 membrane protein [Idiomarina xiamenensis 10-D-4]
MALRRPGYWVMFSSALLMAAAGICLLFFPALVDTWVLPIGANNALALQLLAAVYLGMAMMNHMAKGQLLGGIYGRPICVGNFMHFLIGLFILIKQLLDGSVLPGLIAATAIYALYTIIFARLLFRMPPVVERL